MTNLRAALIQTRERHGVLTPQAVVEDARPEGAPLHDRFEWDDAKAGELYRVDQARALIRSVKISYVRPSGETADLREFVSVSRPDVPAREYVTVDEVREDPVLRALALRDAEREWRELYGRYSHLQEFVDAVRSDVAAA